MSVKAWRWVCGCVLRQTDLREQLLSKLDSLAARRVLVIDDDPRPAT